MDPIDALRGLDGIARYGELAARAVPRRALGSAVTAGEVLRLRSGVYAVADIDPDLAVAAAVGGKLAGSMQLARLGVWTLPPTTGIEVWIPPEQHVRVPTGKLCIFRDRAWSDDGRVGVSVLHALRQLGSACRDPSAAAQERLLVAVESALNKRLIVPDDLSQLRRGLPAAAIRVLDVAVTSSQSGLESLVRWRLALAGIPTRAQQRIGHSTVDLVVGRTLILELDGRRFHDFETDRERDTAHAADGFVTLRWSSRMVLSSWPSCERALATYMRLGLHEL